MVFKNFFAGIVVADAAALFLLVLSAVRAFDFHSGQRRIPFNPIQNGESPIQLKFSASSDGEASYQSDESSATSTTGKSTTRKNFHRIDTSLPSLPKLIVTCATTDELVTAIDAYVEPHHVVAEIGSQLRDVSSSICEISNRVCMVDIERKFPKARQDRRRTEAMRLSAEESTFVVPEESCFYEIPQLSDWPRAIFSDPSQQYDILVLDVNAIVGNDLEWTSLQVVQQFHSWNNNENLLVLVKSSGLNQWANRIHHPQYWNDHQEELWNVLPTPPFVIATVGVQEYRSTIEGCVRPTDFVLEVGCHYGTTTALLKEHAAHCMGVDVGSKIIAQANQRHPGIDFRVGDAWKTAELLRFLEDYKAKNNEEGIKGFDVIYVDVGGLSGSDGLLEAIQLISSLRFALEPRCIIIKSLCMQRLSSKLVCFWRLKKRLQQAGSVDQMDGT